MIPTSQSHKLVTARGASACARNKLFNGLRQMPPSNKTRDLVIFARHTAD